MKNFMIHAKGMTLLRALLVCAALWLPSSMLGSIVLHVPTREYPTIKKAYDAAHDQDTIEIQPNLYQEIPPALFDKPNKLVLFRVASGRAIITASNPPPNEPSRAARFSPAQTSPSPPTTILRRPRTRPTTCRRMRTETGTSSVTASGLSGPRLPAVSRS
jgi:hypothetical protein